MNMVQTICVFLFSLCAAFSAICGVAIQLSENGLSIFQYYSVDSNMLSAAAGILLIVFLIRQRIKNKPVPVWVTLSYFTAAVCHALTLLMVVFVLAPAFGTESYGMVLTGYSMLCSYLITPILMIVSALFFLPRIPTKIQEIAHIALLPTELYGLIAVVSNFMLWWNGPYPFLRLYDQPVWDSVLWCAGILGGTYLIGFLLAIAKKAVDRYLRH